MMRKILSASVATALLCSSIAPAFAQNYAFEPAQAPLGATATLNFKVPLGGAAAKQRKASYGFTMGYGQRLNSTTADGRIATRSAKLADIRFTADDKMKLQKAEFASFDLANLDKDKRLNLGPDGTMDTTTWLLIGGLIAAGVIIWVVAKDDDDDDDVDETP